MNNKTASMIRDFGMARVFDGMDFSELVKIDSGKFVFPINTDEGDFWCEVDFVAKKDDFDAENAEHLYQVKLQKAIEKELEQESKKKDSKKKTE